MDDSDLTDRNLGRHDIRRDSKKVPVTPNEQAVLASLVAAARVLWVRVGDATDADVNRLGAALIAAKALLEAQKGTG